MAGGRPKMQTGQNIEDLDETVYLQK